MYRVLLCALASSALASSAAQAEPRQQRLTYYTARQSAAVEAPDTRYATVQAPATAYGSPYASASPYGEPPPAPTGGARYAATRPNLGGGFIEAIFGGPSAGDAANPYSAQRHTPSPNEYSRFSVDPRFQRQLVAYSGQEPVGTVVVDTDHYFLYLVQGGGKAIRYGVGVGRPGFTWSGVHTVSAKREWPDWRPPDEMLRRRPDLPHFMPGGPENPLGARALYLGDTLYRIHGSNEPNTIGTQVSSGCIRMRNEDVIDLYGRVTVGTKVVVL